jgi:hypothetical protein
MFSIHSIFGRVAISKSIGAVLGGVAFFGLPLLGAESSTLFNLGIWLLTILMGAMIGFIGIMTVHPLFNFRLPFYVRGAVVGASFFLLLPLLAMDQMNAFMQLEIVQWFGLVSPWWVVLEGAVWGIILSGITTAICGEGDLPVS